MIETFKLWICKLLLALKKRKRDPESDTIFMGNNILPDTDDPRDYVVSLEPPTLKPLVYELPIDAYSFVKDQGTWASCGSHAMVTALEITHQLMKTGRQVPLSERYHYYHVRQLEYMANYPNNAGQTAREMLKVAQQIGIAPEKLCPYISTQMNDKPDGFADGFAGLWKIDAYYRLTTLEDIKNMLLHEFPILMGVECNASFMDIRNKEIFVKGEDEAIFGAHEILCYGYSDIEQVFYCINSWGTIYKDKGLMKVPYDYYEKYAIDTWAFDIKH